MLQLGSRTGGYGVLKIYNARLLTGELATISIENGLFGNIEIQKANIKLSHTLDLSQFDQQKSGEFDAKEELILPGAIDVHVHSRDPGHTHKETWHTLAASAYHGGVIAVCDMPNTTPPVMTKHAVMEKAAIAQQAGIEFRLYLGVGKDNIHQLAEILQDQSLPLCGLKVYYGQSTGSLMFDDLEALAQALPDPMRGVLVFHSEDQCCIDKNMEAMAAKLSKGLSPSEYVIHSKIRSSEAAWASSKTIIDWAKRWSKEIHIAHLSTPQEMELVEAAKSQGVKVTTEVATHHLIFSMDDYAKLGALIKMNPPVRSREERDALAKFFAQEKIDYFATDHAPHTLEEKKLEYIKCPSGVPGLDYFWPQLLDLADQHQLSATHTLNMAGWNAGERFGFKQIGRIEKGFKAHFVWVKKQKQEIKNQDVLSKCGWTPYAGQTLNYTVFGTWMNGHCVFRRK